MWTHRRELDWAREAWQRLTDAGLTGYTTERERCAVGMRFLALAQIYLDWCIRADDFREDDQLESWAYELGIGTFHLGQLVGDDEEFDTQDEGELRSSALSHLTAWARPEVVDGPAQQLWRSKRTLSLPLADQQPRAGPEAVAPGDTNVAGEHRGDRAATVAVHR